VSCLPEISVIIPLFNAANDLKDLITCLEGQTYPRERVEYLLVDNNSQDNTSALLEKIAATTPIKLIPLTEKEIQSSYAARNQGMRNAHTEIFVFSDGDCRPVPKWLEKIVEPFSNPDVGIVAGGVQALPSENLFEKYSKRSDFMNQKYLLEHPFCSYGQTANLAVRKAAFEMVGLFRPYLTTGGDADICWRIQKQTAWRLEYVPEATILHRHRSSLAALQSQLRRYGTSNRYLHELYGVELMKEFSFSDLWVDLSRWLVKEVPTNMVKFFLGKADVLDFWQTPLDLICFESRSTGQKLAKLPEKAREIVWF
jgi:cellulose synthase/poly-beta-1,6-N-acetylglucosamine synthase-like glycosyltransferase